MGRIRGYHVLFGVTLACLGALGAWWSVFFMRSVELERSSQVDKLVHVTVVTALMIGQRAHPPAPGSSLGGPAKLEVIRANQRTDGDLFSAFVPRHPELGVRPDPSLLAEIDRHTERRRLMFIGEGALLFVLLGICTVMLYRLVSTERRSKARMEAFLSVVTHEMKTPLAGIKSMLQTFAAGAVPADQHQVLYAMGLKEAERLEHMVENVLISGRLRTEAVQVYNEPVELRPLLDGFVEHRRRYLVSRPEAIELAWEFDEEDARVVCDRSALNVVLENLVDNAFKYGGAEPVVTLRARRQADRVQLAVEDRGQGFDPARAQQLFVPFRRIAEGADEAQHGTGLGLAIAKALVERMGGELTAESDGQGQGSRFSVWLSVA